MPESKAMIAIRFKKPSLELFKDTKVGESHANWIVMGLQPDNTLRIELQAKQPGLEMKAHTVGLETMESDDNKHKLDAYEALILDAIQGDRSLFLRADEVNLAWKAVDPILEKWSEEKDFIHTYTAGTWGPEEVEQLKDNSCHAWRNNV